MAIQGLSELEKTGLNILTDLFCLFLQFIRSCLQQKGIVLERSSFVLKSVNVNKRLPQH